MLKMRRMLSHEFANPGEQYLAKQQGRVYLVEDESGLARLRQVTQQQANDFVEEHDGQPA